MYTCINKYNRGAYVSVPPLPVYRTRHFSTTTTELTRRRHFFPGAHFKTRPLGRGSIRFLVSLLYENCSIDLYRASSRTRIYGFSAYNYNMLIQHHQRGDGRRSCRTCGYFCRTICGDVRLLITLLSS